MTDALNQSDIDALLSAITGSGGSSSAPSAGGPGTAGAASPPMSTVPQAPAGSGDTRPRGRGPGEMHIVSLKAAKKKRKIKLYDFRRPDKFAKEQLRTVSKIHDSFARSLTTTLSAMLRAMVHIQVISVEQVTYEEFIRSVANPTFISVFETGGDLKGKAIFELNLGVAFAIVERLFGGMGKSGIKMRSLTNIEEAVMAKILKTFLDNLKIAWDKVVKLDPKVDVIESNPAFTQIVPPTDMVLLVTFEVQIIDAEGIINLCIPHMVLEPILDKLSAQYLYIGISADDSERARNLLTGSLNYTEVPICVELGRANMSFTDVVNLAEGDIVILDKSTQESLDILVEDSVKFRGRPGVADNNKIGVSVVEVIDNPEEVKL